MLVDEIWHAVGDEASDIDWYVKRTILGGIYSSTEVYMLTDSSPGSLSLLPCASNFYTLVHVYLVCAAFLCFHWVVGCSILGCQ